MVKHITRGALPTLAGVLFLLCGCTKEEEPRAVADAPSVYMKDPAYAAAKADVMASRGEVVSARETLIAEMSARVEAVRAKMPGADEEAIKAELEKDPEWRSLEKRMNDANAAYEDNLSKAHKLIGDRIAPKKISK